MITNNKPALTWRKPALQSQVVVIHSYSFRSIWTEGLFWYLHIQPLLSKLLSPKGLHALVEIRMSIITWSFCLSWLNFLQTHLTWTDSEFSLYTVVSMPSAVIFLHLYSWNIMSIFSYTTSNLLDYCFLSISTMNNLAFLKQHPNPWLNLDTSFLNLPGTYLQVNN